jgi:catechol 2,3-dioxygenase-like lactoylglutathione lyase family enzyme
MQVRHIDHVNIKIPEDRVEDAVAFYRDVFGFEPEKLDAYRAGERTSFAFRLGETSLLHVRPVEDFEPPSGDNYDHFCLVLEAGIEELRDLLDEHGIEIRREGEPFGATGRAPAVYIEDPFGYVLELKAGGR